MSLAGAAVFLASEMARYIAGQTIHVDGGTHAASDWYHKPETGEYILGPHNTQIAARISAGR